MYPACWVAGAWGRILGAVRREWVTLVSPAGCLFTWQYLHGSWQLPPCLSLSVIPGTKCLHYPVWHIAHTWLRKQILPGSFLVPMDTMPLLTHRDPSAWAAAISEQKWQQWTLSRKKSEGWGKKEWTESDGYSPCRRRDMCESFLGNQTQFWKKFLLLSISWGGGGGNHHWRLPSLLGSVLMSFF